MYAESSSEMPIPVYDTTRRHILEDRYLNIDYTEGLKSQLHNVCFDARQLELRLCDRARSRAANRND